MAADWRRWVLRDVVRALPCKHFEIKLVTQPSDGTNGRCIKVLALTPYDLAAKWKQFGRWSAQRLNVFIRPVGGPVHVLLDLDTPGTLEEVLNMMFFDGIVPSLVVETSPGRAQVWCSLAGREHAAEIHKAACQLICERYGGDPGSAKPSQPGRLPGTRNPKPARASADGAPPLVRICSSGESHGVKFQPSFRPSTSLLTDAKTKAENETRRSTKTNSVAVKAQPVFSGEIVELAEMVSRATIKNGGDRSRADFGIAAMLLRAGDPPERVAALLLQTSTKAKERERRQTGAGLSYVERTVLAAMCQLQEAIPNE